MSIRLAEYFNTEIVSADSRQVFKEMHIGTAVPSEEELNRVKHHFIGHLSIHEEYSAGVYETDAISLLNELFKKHDTVLLTGGSGLYVKAVTHGLDEHPSDTDIRNQLIEDYRKNGIGFLQDQLKTLDPVTYGKIDLQNHQRMIRALEVCIASGKPYSAFLTENEKERNFKPIVLGLKLPRPLLVSRINQRVDQMVAQGLVEEARRLYPLRHLNALQTVGYKELFRAFDGEMTESEAVEAIKVNTRRFAKRQMTWFKKHIDATWFEPGEYTEITQWIKQKVSST